MAPRHANRVRLVLSLRPGAATALKPFEVHRICLRSRRRGATVPLANAVSAGQPRTVPRAGGSGNFTWSGGASTRPSVVETQRAVVRADHVTDFVTGLSLPNSSSRSRSGVGDLAAAALGGIAAVIICLHSGRHRRADCTNGPLLRCPQALASRAGVQDNPKCRRKLALRICRLPIPEPQPVTVSKTFCSECPRARRESYRHVLFSKLLRGGRGAAIFVLREPLADPLNDVHLAPSLNRTTSGNLPVYGKISFSASDSYGASRMILRCPLPPLRRFPSAL